MRTANMNRRVKIALLGLMMWVITFTSGFFTFVIFGSEESGPSTEEHSPSIEEHIPETEEHALSTDMWWTNGIKALFLGISLALALLLVYRDKRQNYKRTAWEAGIAWYLILLLMDLIVLFGLLGLELELWFPLILVDSIVVIIPIVVGYLLAGARDVVSLD